jgi:DNA-binding MarR family transcriptional regulator
MMSELVAPIQRKVRSKATRRSASQPRRTSKARARAEDKPTPDQVDAIVAQWRRERPDLDPAPMRLLGLLAQAHQAMTPFITRAVAARGLARGTFDVLCALRRAGSPFSLSPKQLSESLMLSGAGMTSRLDRLEGAGLVERRPDPRDRRSLNVRLTRAGRRLIDSLIPQVVAAQWQLVSELGLRETDELIGLLSRLTIILAGSDGAGTIGKSQGLPD